MTSRTTSKPKEEPKRYAIMWLEDGNLHTLEEAKKEALTEHADNYDPDDSMSLYLVEIKQKAVPKKVEFKTV